MQNNIAKSVVGGFVKSTPLISFHTIIDEDVSLILHIIKEYRNKDVFDLDKVQNMTLIEIISELYKRKYNNPLYFLMKDEKYKKFLDECYNEFINEKESDFLNDSISTEIINLVQSFNKSGDINPYILYYTDAQLKVLESMNELSGIPKISINDINSKSIDIYSQIFFKSVDEVVPHMGYLFEKTLYFSNAGLNLNDENNDITFKDDIIKNLIIQQNSINLFDMYRMDILENIKTGGNSDGS